MPLYLFQHPTSEEVTEVFFHMNDEPKEYIDDKEVRWERIFTSINLSPTYRSFDEKRLTDANGNPLKVQHLSDDFIRRQGFDNATDYIDHNNSVHVNPEKTPEANLDKRADQLRDKSFQGKIKDQKARLKENSKKAARQKRSASSAGKLSITATLGKGKKQVFKVNNPKKKK